MMSIWGLALYVFVICQRVAELLIAKRNESWLKKQGAVEEGEEHYKWFVFVHSFFFLSILLESNFIVDELYFSPTLFAIFIIAQLLRVWCIISLGKYWNTKIIVLPGTKRIAKGPYRYIKHPNYWIVGIELLVIPLLMQAYFTALVFPFLHILLLTKRIPVEEKALATHTEPDN